MSEIKSFFLDLRQEINRAKTKRALRLLERRGRDYVKRLSSPLIKMSVRKQARSEYRKSLQMIKRRNKSLR